MKSSHDIHIGRIRERERKRGKEKRKNLLAFPSERRNEKIMVIILGGKSE